MILRCRGNLFIRFGKYFGICSLQIGPSSMKNHWFERKRVGFIGKLSVSSSFDVHVFYTQHTPSHFYVHF